MEYVAARVFYGMACAMRLLFLSSRTGALIHNLVIYGIDRIMFPRFGRITPDIPEITRMYQNHGWRAKNVIKFTERIYRLNPSYRRRLLENLTVWRVFIGYVRRKRCIRKERVIPPNIYLSPTYQCNLSCRGCYASAHTGEMPIELVERIVREQEEFGAYHILLLGGEPLLRDDLWQVFARHPHTLFEVFTNGTSIDKDGVQRIVRLGNVRLIISLEGFQEKTDRRRGEGVYEKATTLLSRCQEANIFYGISVMVSQDNFAEVASEEFVKEMDRFGVYFISYILYMPFGEDGEDSLVLRPEQIEYLNQWSERMQLKYPIFFVVGRNGSDRVTACPAADGRIHITASGDVEPCMFCHFAADNIRDKSIVEAMRSEFFWRIRMLNSCGVSCFTPCKTARSPYLQHVFKETGAYPTVLRGQEK